MRRHQLARSAALALALAALAAPGAAAQSSDLRSPDARDAAAAAEMRRDLRSPDARDAALRESAKWPAYVSALTPQERAAAAARRTAAPNAKLAPVAQTPNDGIVWRDALIGAAGPLGLGLVALAAFSVVQRRQRVAGPRESATTG